MYQIINIVSGVLLVIAGIPYIVGIVKRSIRPRPLSWLGWLLIMGVSLFAQIVENGFSFFMSILFASSLVCFLVFTLSLLLKNYTVKSSDYFCFILGIICVVVYIGTKDAFITTVFSILADLFVGIPTLLNVYRDPRSEGLLSWGIGSVATFLSFVMSMYSGDLLLKLFPTYLFAFNFLMFLFCLKRFKKTALL